MIRKLLIIGSALIAAGLFLAVRNITYIQSSCWGHLGCNYYTRTFSSLSWVGLILIGAGAIYFCKGLLPKKGKIISRLLLTILIIVILIICISFYSPSLIFTY
jgi:hypothetical protein